MKNKKRQRKIIFGTKSCPNPKSKYRQKTMDHINQWCLNFLNLPNSVTPGKINASGKLINKPNWDHRKLTYENNPDAFIHELGHLFTMPLGVSLKDYDKIMREQYGFCMKNYGYLQQKRSIFEIIPMGIEQKIRRVLGLPANTNHVKVEKNTPYRREIETGNPCAIRLKKNNHYVDLIRLASNLDDKTLERVDKILNREILFDVNKGWYLNQDINAKINRRARIKNKKKKVKIIIKPHPPEILELSQNEIKKLKKRFKFSA